MSQQTTKSDRVSSAFASLRTARANEYIKLVASSENGTRATIVRRPMLRVPPATSGCPLFRGSLENILLSYREKLLITDNTPHNLFCRFPHSLHKVH